MDVSFRRGEKQSAVANPGGRGARIARALLIDQAKPALGPAPTQRAHAPAGRIRLVCRNAASTPAPQLGVQAPAVGVEVGGPPPPGPAPPCRGCGARRCGHGPRKRTPRVPPKHRGEAREKKNVVSC